MLAAFPPPAIAFIVLCSSHYLPTPCFFYGPSTCGVFLAGPLNFKAPRPFFSLFNPHRKELNTIEIRKIAALSLPLTLASGNSLVDRRKAGAGTYRSDLFWAPVDLCLKMRPLAPFPGGPGPPLPFFCGDGTGAFPKFQCGPIPTNGGKNSPHILPLVPSAPVPPPFLFGDFGPPVNPTPCPCPPQ